MGAGAVGRVERKEPRREFFYADVAVGAGVTRGIEHGRAVRLRLDQTLGQFERVFETVRQAAVYPLFDDKPVDDDAYRVLLVLVEFDLLVKFTVDAVDDRAHIAVFVQLFELFGILALAPSDYRRDDAHFRSLGRRQNAVGDLIDGLLLYLLAALGAMHLAHTRVQQTQIVVYLRHRADGGTGIVGSGLLIDGDRRRKPVDVVDVGLVHLPEELARIR